MKEVYLLSATKRVRQGKREAWQKSGKKGWTFSIGDMEHLGIKNVSYSDSIPYKDSPQVLKYLMIFEFR